MPMGDNSNTDPISTVKVDFGSSKGCPPDVRKMLKDLKGVKSIIIDPKKGEVKVVGDVNPTTIMKLFEKIGTKAKLCSFEKEPKKRHSSSHSKHKHHSHSCCESSDSEDEFEAGYRSDHHRHRTRHNPPMNGYYHGPPMSGYHHYPPHPPSMPWNHPMPYGYGTPMYPGPPPPPPPMYPGPPPPPPMYPGPSPMYGYYGM